MLEHISTILTDTFIATEFLLPERFKNWGDAVEAVIKARGNTVSPYDVDNDIWKKYSSLWLSNWCSNWCQK